MAALHAFAACCGILIDAGEIILWLILANVNCIMFNEGKDVFSLNAKINCESHICRGIVLRKTVMFLGPGFVVHCV